MSKKISNTVKTFVASTDIETVKQYITGKMSLSDATVKGKEGVWISLEIADTADKARELITIEFNELSDERMSELAFEQFYIRYQDKARIDLQTQLHLIESKSIISRSQQKTIKDMLSKATSEERIYASESATNLLEVLTKYK